jgi:hypothetical protein
MVRETGTMAELDAVVHAPFSRLTNHHGIHKLQ